MTERRAATYEEQIALIRRKGFILYEDEEEDCIAFLKKVNYYRFSSYFFPHLKEDRSFEPGISFFRLQRTYEFDSRIRSLIFEVIEDVEVYLRTQLSYYISQKYGPYGHLGDGMYTKKHNERSFQSRVRSCVEKNHSAESGKKRRKSAAVDNCGVFLYGDAGLLLSRYEASGSESDRRGDLRNRCETAGELASLCNGAAQSLCPLSAVVLLVFSVGAQDAGRV